MHDRFKFFKKEHHFNAWICRGKHRSGFDVFYGKSPRKLKNSQGSVNWCRAHDRHPKKHCCINGAVNTGIVPARYQKFALSPKQEDGDLLYRAFRGRVKLIYKRFTVRDITPADMDKKFREDHKISCPKVSVDNHGQSMFEFMDSMLWTEDEFIKKIVLYPRPVFEGGIVVDGSTKFEPVD